MYKIRKCETYKVVRSTEVATIDPEKFRNLPTPYEGESEEEFIQYLSEIDLWDIESELDSETMKEVFKLIEPEWNEFYNSSQDGSENWFEIGEENGEFYNNNCGFETKYTTEY